MLTDTSRETAMSVAEGCHRSCLLCRNATSAPALELLVCSWSVQELFVQRLAIPEAAAQELRPCRHVRQRIALLGQQSPELWMVPTQFVTRSIAVGPNTCTQPFDFRHERVSIEIGEVFVHPGALPPPLH